MSANPARYGIYYMPPAHSQLGQLAAAWLGRDAHAGAALARPIMSQVDGSAMAAATATPSHYGFHGTLKPPFHLYAGQREAELEQALAAFCRLRPPFDISPLTVQSMGNFLALRPVDDSPALGGLAADCVRAFDSFRAAPGQDELARRRASGLTERQLHLLGQWGYPYVMDQFRFHMTLTGPLSASARPVFASALQEYFQAVCRSPLSIDALTLVRQPNRNTPFQVLQRYPFGGDGTKSD